MCGVCVFNMLTDRTAVCAVHDMVMAMGGGGVVFPKMLPSHSVSETKQNKKSKKCSFIYKLTTLTNIFLTQKKQNSCQTMKQT